MITTLNAATMIAAFICATVFGGNLFDVIVNEKNLIKGFPESLSHIRSYYKFRNPGHFFKYLTPLFFVFGVFALILSFNISRIKFILIILALISYAITQFITFIYFFPQNKILREAPTDEVSGYFNELSTKRSFLDIIRNVFTSLAFFLLLVSLTEF